MCKVMYEKDLTTSLYDEYRYVYMASNEGIEKGKRSLKTLSWFEVGETKKSRGNCYRLAIRYEATGALSTDCEGAGGGRGDVVEEEEKEEEKTKRVGSWRVASRSERDYEFGAYRSEPSHMSFASPGYVNESEITIKGSSMDSGNPFITFFLIVSSDFSSVQNCTVNNFHSKSQ
ncbi:hypothetical protein V1477_020841 [Vespula maculifrons]|uniref:Uncharacterized protein n=1 Tax=Vespula maculifrons TaxID=7453 RepID=A0ABD2AN29_VESMC